MALALNSSLHLDNVLSGQTYYRKSSFEEPLSDLSFYLTILDSGSSGFAYHHSAPAQGDNVKRLIDRNAIEVLTSEDSLEFPLRVSLLDAIYGECNRLQGRVPYRTYTQDGSYQEKADFRSNLVTEGLLPGSRVLLVGLVTEFVRDMIVTISNASGGHSTKCAFRIAVIKVLGFAGFISPF